MLIIVQWRLHESQIHFNRIFRNFTEITHTSNTSTLFLVKLRNKTENQVKSKQTSNTGRVNVPKGDSFA